MNNLSKDEINAAQQRLWALGEPQIFDLYVKMSVALEEMQDALESQRQRYVRIVKLVHQNAGREETCAHR